MYSVKPGRGPSLMAAFGGVIAALFGVGWTVMALRMGAPVIFPYFGVLFTVVALGGAAYSLFNALSANRMSNMDITEDDEESDPIDRVLRPTKSGSEGGMTRRALFSRTERKKTPPRFHRNLCPYCGAPVQWGAKKCDRCAKDI